MKNQGVSIQGDSARKKLAPQIAEQQAAPLLFKNRENGTAPKKTMRSQVYRSARA
jgi:hypothetical protein